MRMDVGMANASLVVKSTIALSMNMGHLSVATGSDINLGLLTRALLAGTGILVEVASDFHHLVVGRRLLLGLHIKGREDRIFMEVAHGKSFPSRHFNKMLIRSSGGFGGPRPYRLRSPPNHGRRIDAGRPEWQQQMPGRRQQWQGRVETVYGSESDYESDGGYY